MSIDFGICITVKKTLNQPFTVNVSLLLDKNLVWIGYENVSCNFLFPISDFCDDTRLKQFECYSLILII